MAVVDPVQKFNEPLTINPKLDVRIFWIVLRKALIAAENQIGYPDLTVD